MIIKWFSILLECQQQHLGDSSHLWSDMYIYSYVLNVNIASLIAVMAVVLKEWAFLQISRMNAENILCFTGLSEYQKLHFRRNPLFTCNTLTLYVYWLIIHMICNFLSKILHWAELGRAGPSSRQGSKGNAFRYHMWKKKDKIG